MNLRVLPLAATALLAASALFGQIREGTVEIEPFAGYLFGGQFPHPHRSMTLFHSVDVEDDPIYGGRVGYNISQLFEVEFQYSQTNSAFQTQNDFGGGTTLGDLKIQYFLGYSTFNFGHGRVVPYVTVGAGAAELTPKVAGLNLSSDTRFTASFGAGLKVFLTPHFGLRFDGRGYSTLLGDHTYPCGYYSTCVNSSWLTNGDATGGIVIAF